LKNCRIAGDQLLGGPEKFDAKLASAQDGESSGSSATLSALERSRPVVAQAIDVAWAAYE
jgi:hypothetical protein